MAPGEGRGGGGLGGFGHCTVLEDSGIANGLEDSGIARVSEDSIRHRTDNLHDLLFWRIRTHWHTLRVRGWRENRMATRTLNSGLPSVESPHANSDTGMRVWVFLP